jgi:hypothetical protein
VVVRPRGHLCHQVVWPPRCPPPSLLWTPSRVGKMGTSALFCPILRIFPV